MNYYDRLNLAIQNSLNDNRLQLQLKYFDEITKLAHIIIDNTKKLKPKEYSSNVPLNVSIQTVTDFFASIKPEYSSMFQNILREKDVYNGKEDVSVKFSKIENEYNGNHSGVGNDGSVQIDYAENLDDTFTIAHEIGHYFLHRNGFSFARTERQVPAYSDPEWQANTFASFLLMPRAQTSFMSIEDIEYKCGVSHQAAEIAYKRNWQ